MGRLRGALSAHADGVFGEINGQKYRLLAKKIFLELVQLGEGAPDTRRRIRKEELLALGTPGEVELLLAQLASSRLIALGSEAEETFAEVSHEMLIREWACLREWIAQNREELRLGRRLAEGVQEWEGLKRDAGTLLHGSRLAQAEEWLLKHPDATAQIREFVRASVTARKEAERRKLRRLRWFSSVLALLLLLAIGAIWFARREQSLAEARALAAEFEEMLTQDPGRALDVAMRGWNTAKTPETYAALTEALPQTLNVLNHDGEVVVSVFSPDGQRILTASYDGTARIWNAADGKPLATLRHGDKVEHAAFSPDGKRVVTASWDHTARVWNTADGRLLATLKGHGDAVLRAEFSPDGERVVTASADRTARIWSATDGRLLAILKGHTDTVWAGSFSPDGKRIATASLDNTARIWNAADGRLLLILQGQTYYILRPEFSPDGERIVTPSYDGTARIWNANDGRLLAILHHEGTVRRATFSPDGNSIVTASWDNSARIWNATTGALLATLRHEGKVNHAEFSPDGKYVVTTSYDRMARVWRAIDGQLLVSYAQGPRWPGDARIVFSRRKTSRYRQQRPYGTNVEPIEWSHAGGTRRTYWHHLGRGFL